MICEICGSNMLVKELGLYVCRYCETKYTIDEARKLFHNAPVEDPRDVDNLRLLARRSLESGQNPRAKRYFELALLKDPNLWDAWFYSIYFETLNCRRSEIAEMAEQLYACQETILRMIQDFVTDPKKEREAVEELSRRFIELSERLFVMSKSAHYDYANKNQIFEKTKLVVESMGTRDVLYHFGDLLILLFKETHGDLAAACWEVAAKQHAFLHPVMQDKKASEVLFYSYGRKIRKYNPHYIAPRLKRSGCYVATAVYGSYDCPQVWTLRRYRDDTLAKTRGGRLFIRFYYAVSPHLVQLFGESNWFRKLTKPPLDRLVHRLKEQGVDDTPYADKE